MDYPVFKQAELQQALSACQMRIKPDIKELSSTQMQNLTTALESDDESVRGFASLVALAYGAIEANVEEISRMCLEQLCSCSQSPVDFVRQYSTLALARVAELYPQTLVGLQLLDGIAGFSGNQLSEDSYDAPAFFLAKYFAAGEPEEVTDRTAQELLVYLCQRLHCQLGEADRGVEVSTILSALKALIAQAQFAQQSLCARVPTSLVSYLSGFLNAGEACSSQCVILIFDILNNVFASLSVPLDAVEASDFEAYMQQETQSLAEMDFYGIIRLYTLPTDEEPSFDSLVFKSVLRFLATAMRTRALAEDCFNHFQNRASQSTVVVADFLVGVFLHVEGDIQCVQSIFEIAMYFCYFRYISERIAMSPFIQLTCDFLKGVAQNNTKQKIGDFRHALESIFGFIIAVTADATAFIDSSKLFFDDFETTEKLALREPGERLFTLFDPLLDLADLTSSDQFLYQSNINAIYSVSQFSVPLMPFLHAATSLELLRNKFKTVRPSRIPPVGISGLRALLHLINQKRSIKLSAIVPFSLRLLCRVPEHQELINQRSTWVSLNNEVDWLTSDENLLSRLGQTLTRSGGDELSDETLLQKRLNIQGYAIEAVVEVLQLLAVLCARENVDFGIVSNVLSAWAQLTSCSPEKAEEGACVVGALGTAIGAAGVRRLQGAVSDGLLALLQSGGCDAREGRE